MRRLVKPVKRRSTLASLAPMVDLLTILLVFLLLSYSTDPSVRPEDPSFALPSSTATAPVNKSLALELTEEGLYLDGVRIAGSRYYLEQDEDLVEELYSALSGHTGRLQVRVDEDMPYLLVRKVLFTAQQAGVEDLTLVATSRASL